MAKQIFRSPKGTRDILPDEQKYWFYLFQIIEELTAIFGYQALSNPIFEETALFQRGVGETTDIVEKEMYTFTDKGKEKKSMTLRPEFTAGVVRSYIQNGMASWPTPVKLWSTGPIFRYERPQAGRFRQFHQFNVEAIGEQDPALDFEIMDMAWQLYARLNFKNLSFQLNNIGCPECRPAYLDVLKKYYHEHTQIICEDCRNRLLKNPLRLLDCKQIQCQPVIEKAPAISKHLCESCDTHFSQLRSYLDATGRRYTLNHRLVRGLDYYSKTVFEVWAEGIGSQNAVCGGGRYDGLVEILGGQSTPAIGFAAGLERIVMIMEHQNIEVPELSALTLYFACQNQEAQKQALILATECRQNGIACIVGLGGRSFKAQFREANKRKADMVATLGDHEIKNDTVVLKDMGTGEQNTIKSSELVSFINKVAR